MVRYGLANVPIWAFPTTDAGWQELGDMPLFRAFNHFSNNNVDSKWHRFEPERWRYVLTKLHERGKTYRLTLLDRDIGMADLGSVSDNGLRKWLWLGIKRGDAEVWEKAVRWMQHLRDSLPELQHHEVQVGNGAEWRDTVERYKFEWDEEHAPWSDAMCDTLERIAIASMPCPVIVGDFRHRYWARKPDGTIYRHYHRTLSANGERRIYQETGVYENMDTVGDSRKMWRAMRKYADEWWWHGVVSIKAGDTNLVKAWSHATLQELDYPPERREYSGQLTVPGFEEFLLEVVNSDSALL